jgi:hypothetical protein
MGAEKNAGKFFLYFYASGLKNQFHVAFNQGHDITFGTVYVKIPLSYHQTCET